MKLLWLKEIIGDAYTEEMDAAACQAIGKDFVARADFNAKNTRVKELEAQVGQLEEAAKGHAKQLEELKKSAGDNEELTRKIGELEQQAKADRANYEKELAAVRLSSAVDAELTAAGAKNTVAVKAVLADYLKDAKIVDGKVVAKMGDESITLAAKVEALKKDASTDFLFGSAPKYEGWKPGESGDGRKPGEGKKPSEMSYSELAAYLAENPDAKLD
jgi:vacuolar-type H+-ATPase subunit I/STV1